MRRAAVPAVVVLVLALAGCYRVVYPNQAPPKGSSYQTMWPAPQILGEYELCAFASDAVHQIVRELWSAPDEAALVPQTVESYLRYAERLRELAAQADTDERRSLIEKAADVAEAFAREVERTQSYHVSIDPVVAASMAAFPGCDLDG